MQQREDDLEMEQEIKIMIDSQVKGLQILEDRLREDEKDEEKRLAEEEDAFYNMAAENKLRREAVEDLSAQGSEALLSMEKDLDRFIDAMNSPLDDLNSPTLPSHLLDLDQDETNASSDKLNVNGPIAGASHNLQLNAI